jgi:hypothetical protein
VNFSELRTGEVCRIPIPRTWVNKGIKKGRGRYTPTLVSLLVDVPTRFVELGR